MNTELLYACVCVCVYYVCIESCYVKGCWVNVGECITASFFNAALFHVNMLKSKVPITIYCMFVMKLG